MLDEPLLPPLTATIRDVEEAAQTFSSVEVDIRFDRLKDRSAFALDFAAVRMGAAELMTTTWGTDTWFKVESASDVAVVVNPACGAPSVFTTSGESVLASRTIAPILLPEREIRVFRPAGTPLLLLCARMDDLERLLREITGSDRGWLEFSSGLNRESPEGRRLQRIIDFALGELSLNPSAVDNPIVRRQLDDLVLGGILSLPGKHHRLIERSNGSLGAAVVRRAEEFMEANVDRPISMSDVAAACSCSRTKLFLAFKRERAWTPLQFLVRRRMEWARRALLAPKPGMTVTKVSLDCGYASLSRFTQAYRKLYGETPSMTLNRSRRRVLEGQIPHRSRWVVGNPG